MFGQSKQKMSNDTFARSLFIYTDLGWRPTLVGSCAWRMNT